MKKLSEILEIGMIIYNPEWSVNYYFSPFHSFMCSCIDIQNGAGLLTFEESNFCKVEIHKKISGWLTLGSYLEQHKLCLNSRSEEGAKIKIEFYRDWINELKENGL